MFQFRTAFACLIAVAVCALAAPAVRAQDGNSFVIKDPSVLPPKEAENLKRRLPDFLKELPEGYGIAVRMRDFVGGPTTIIRFPELLGPLTPDGVLDGNEYEFADWYREPSRITPYKMGKRDGVERYYYVSDAKDLKLKAEITWVDDVMNGPKITYHEDGGGKASLTTYVNGQVEGESRTWDKDGKLERVAFFKDGRREGTVTDYWTDREDQVKRVVHYTDGKVDGVAREFYANGQLKREIHYVDNQKHGTETSYTVDGVVEKVREYAAGKLVE